MNSRESLAREIGGRIKSLRQQKELSQEGLARLAELSRETVRRAESGDHLPDMSTLRSLAGALGVGLDWLLQTTLVSEG